MGWRLGVIAMFSLVSSAVLGDTPAPQVENPHGKDFDPEKTVFAKIDGKTVMMADYMNYFSHAVRSKFYHGRIPEQEMKKFRGQAKRDYVDRIMLLQAARAKGVTADNKTVESRIQAYQARMSRRPGWDKNKTRVLTRLRNRLQEESLLSGLKTQVEKQVTGARKDEVIAYYKKHPDKFTTPEQLNVSVILLKVAPSAGGPAWKAAREEGERIYKKIKKGGDFAELARLHSADTSASKGGDMGYLHEGMLAPPVYKLLKKLKPGEAAKPVSLLQGVAIFKLKGRKKARLNAFEKVKDRAAKLLLRERKQQHWRRYVEELRANTKIEINEAVL